MNENYLKPNIRQTIYYAVLCFCLTEPLSQKYSFNEILKYLWRNFIDVFEASILVPSHTLEQKKMKKNILLRKKKVPGKWWTLNPISLLSKSTTWSSWALMRSSWSSISLLSKKYNLDWETETWIIHRKVACRPQFSHVTIFELKFWVKKRSLTLKNTECLL